MPFWHSISTVLGFRTTPTTILLILVYAAVFSTVLVTDELPDVPKDQGGLDVDQAYADLHQIAARPHPYNSHSNEIVHRYILSRLQRVASRHSYVHISEDLVSNVSFVVPAYAGYFEGTNILVKIDGSNPNYQDNGGVLFSAHYDSVSTAPGATDDGMGVATLMQLVEYLGERRPERTTVFNINNGEETALRGSRAFMVHPWSNITDTFLNLEGSGNGGRPVLFRTSSTIPLLSFLNTHVPHPHANIISGDAFVHGLIRSSTDYSVYSLKMNGLDLAYYRGRSSYHTLYDSIPNTMGGKKSLWAMMETVRGAGSALLNDDSTHAETGSKESEAAVYFDLFAAVLIVLPTRLLLIIHIVLLVAGPILLLVLAYTKNYVAHRRLQELFPGISHEDGARESIWLQWWKSFKAMAWLGDLRRMGKFWLALVVGICLQILLVVGYVKLNPFIVYSHPYLVLISTSSLFYLSTVLLLNLSTAGPHVLPEQQKLTILFQTYILTWLLLLASTIILVKFHIGGLYFISAWNTVMLLGAAVGCLEGLAVAYGLKSESVEEEGAGERSAARGTIYDGAEASTEREENEGVENDPTENTPLIRQRRRLQWSSAEEGKYDEQRGRIGWWILQLLIVVPVPAILMSHVGLLLIGGMSQTLSDGSSPAIVYVMASFLSILIVLPLAPFSLKLHRYFTILILIIFIASTVFTWLAFPFSQEAPLQVFFQQTLELNLGANNSEAHPSHEGLVQTVTALTGVPEYIDTQVIPHLPSSWGKNTTCFPSTLKPGLVTCTWEGGLSPTPGGATDNDIEAPATRSADWLVVNATRTSSMSARISVKGMNARSCQLQFNRNPVINYHVQGSSESVHGGNETSENDVSDIRLWSRTWDKEFIVDVKWTSKGKKEGKVGCRWAEYESATAGAGGSGAKIPALEEVLSFLPKWTVVSETSDGLVEAWGTFLV